MNLKLKLIVVKKFFDNLLTFNYFFFKDYNNMSEKNNSTMFQ